MSTDDQDPFRYCITTVWVVETGDYEQRDVVLVAASVESALRAIRATYAEPYRVAWHDPQQTDWGGWTLAGDFESVPGFSVEHREEWSLTPYDVMQ